VHRDPVERRDPIAAADARAIPRTVQGKVADDELAVELLQIDAEPRTRRG
jgi:DNA-binding transcriptional regulator YdaS (Cro superfamily)